MGDQNLLSRAPPCVEKQVKLLVPTAFAVVSIQFQGELTSGRRLVEKINAESLLQHDEKHIVPTPLRGIRVRKRRLIEPSRKFSVLNYHHHHLSRETSTAGHRPPPKFSTTIGPVLPSSSVFPRPSPDRRSTLWGA
jgi:hypothetical protein